MRLHRRIENQGRRGRNGTASHPEWNPVHERQRSLVEDVGSSELLSPGSATTSYIWLPFHLSTNRTQPLAVMATRTVVPEMIDELDLRVEVDADVDLPRYQRKWTHVERVEGNPERF